MSTSRFLETPTAPVCAYCHAAKAQSVQLDSEAGPDILTMCLPCLRSATLMKAALSDEKHGKRIPKKSKA